MKDLLVPGSDTDLDRQLVERLRAFHRSEAALGERLKPMDRVVVEGSLWTGAAVLLWIVAAILS